MELNRKNFRAIVFYNFRRGLTQQQCIDELNSIFLQAEFHNGRPSPVVVAETVDAVRQLILQDPHLTYREIETTLGINGSSIYSILHEDLTVKKMYSL